MILTPCAASPGSDLARLAARALVPMPPRQPPTDPALDDEAGPDDPADRPSKSQRKRDSHELQRLGQALAELSPERLATVSMPESLRDAIVEYRRTRSHEGRRRQMQFVGRLMRSAPLEPIREAIDAVRLGRAQDALALHRLERWRDELVADDQALTRWAETHPSSDLQQLRSLVRAARRERDQPAAGTPADRPGAPARRGRAYRELYQFVKSHEESTP
jgi:ribosome-associated protein